MAEGLLFNVIGNLISQLSSLVADNMRMKDDLEKLMDNMTGIKAVVLDAEEQPSTNREVKVWLAKLKDALDDADNLLDDFSFEDKKRQVLTKDCIAEVCIFFTSSNPLLFSFKMGPRVRAIGKRLEDLNVDQTRRLNLIKRNPEERVVKLIETHSFIRQKDVIGREKEKETLVEMLLNTNMDMKENVSVISIVGFGGLGKTALAQLIYNDKAVQEHFELKMWVCVSDSDSDGFNVKTIAKKIIKSTTDDEMDRVQQVLRRKIEGKRYLLVLDDIWNEDHGRWRQLKTLLMDGAKGSKIVITTRSKKVAKISGTSSPFLLKILDEDQAWKLFSQLAFEDGKEPENRTLVSIGRDIVEKCSGFPLAITSVAELMRSMETDDWLNFKKKDLVKIDEERIDEEPGNKVFQIIKLSYDHLPIPLKKCFAFCSLFPKGAPIKKEELIKLWVAQGFVQSSNEICLEDVGNQYFMNLVHRSFFQELFKDDVTDEIVFYQMHDLVHDLAKSVSTNDCVRVTEQGQHIDKRTHHLSCSFRSGSSKIDFPTSFLEANKLRTFFVPVHHDNKASLTVPDCELIMSSSEQLRVLHLFNVGLKMLPSCVDMLKHLRYLNLDGNKEIEVLPRSVTKLYNLEILTLNYCNKLRELPSDFWKLISLRHLELDGCSKLTYMPRGIGQLSNLQTLTLFVLDKKFKRSGGPRELRGLNHLRNHLEIKGLECLREDPSKSKELNLMGKSNLNRLTLTWNTEVVADDDDKDKDYLILQGLLPHHNIKTFSIYSFGGVAISDSINPFTNLLDMELIRCMRLQSLPSLHLLSHLRSLYLYDLPCLEWIDNNGNDDNSSTFFPSLKVLYLFKLFNLKGWCKFCEEGKQKNCRHQLKSLHRLHILDCPNLITLPPSKYIQHIILAGVNEKIVQQAVYHSKVEILQISRINGLKSLSKVLQHLTVLRDLRISNCEELDVCNDEEGCYSMQWKQLTSLRRLELDGIPKMEYMPDGLQNVTTLESLEIRDCSNLRSIPEWTAYLRRCGIKRCPQLVSLPEWVKVLDD